jgi:hypothetical protein
MQNDQNVNEKVDKVEGMEEDYIKVINDLKANSVSKEQYLKMKDENKRLLDTIARGGTIETKPEAKESASDLRKALYGNDCDSLSNLEYWDKTLKLRKIIIESGQPDPLLPIGTHVAPTDADVAAATKVAETVQKCIDLADGNSSVFTNELQRYIADVNMVRPRSRR